MRRLRKLPVGRKKFQPADLTTILIRPRLRRQLGRVAPVAVAWCLLRNNSSPKAPCGTRSASIVPNVIGHWILCWHAMVPTKKFTAARVMESSSGPKGSGSATSRLLSRQTEIMLPHSKCIPQDSQEFLKQSKKCYSVCLQ